MPYKYKLKKTALIYFKWMSYLVFRAMQYKLELEKKGTRAVGRPRTSNTRSLDLRVAKVKYIHREQ